MSGGDLDRAALFDVFSNARRRHAVRYLIRSGGSCDLAPLVEQVAAWENDIDASEVTRTQRRRVYISLYQTHLPMLEDHGIVEWDPDAHAIELHETEETFEPFLRQPPESPRRWDRVYGATTAAGIAAVLVVLLGPVGATAVPVIVATLCGLILGIALLQRRRRQAVTMEPPS